MGLPEVLTVAHGHHSQEVTHFPARAFRVPHATFVGLWEAKVAVQVFRIAWGVSIFLVESFCAYCCGGGFTRMDVESDFSGFSVWPHFQAEVM